MASRNTLAEIKELEKMMKKAYPNSNFVIDHEEGEGPVYPGAVEAQGLTVLRWEGETPIVAWETWEIHELVTCPDCQKEWRNSDIGNASFCFDCLEAMRVARDPRTDAQVRADTSNELAHSLHREGWYQ